MSREKTTQKPDFYYVPSMSVDGMLFYVEVVPVPKEQVTSLLHRDDVPGHNALDDALPRKHIDVDEYVL